MSYLLDTNLLVRLAEPAHAMHPEALQALAALLDRQETVYFVPQNLMEYWVIATRPRERNVRRSITARPAVSFSVRSAT